MRQRGLTNRMAWAVDFERCVNERAASLRSCAEGVLDHIEERQDRRLSCLLGAAPRVRFEDKECASASVTERFGDEPVLGAEVLVQSPLRHSRLRRDRVHSRGRDATRIRQLARRRQERIVGIRPIGHARQYTYRSVCCKPLSSARCATPRLTFLLWLTGWGLS